MVAPSANDWVAAVYEGKWYVGKVLEVNLEDGDANISFLQHFSKCDNTLREPLQPDELWIHFAAVLAVIDPPVPTGKRGRQYKLNKDTVDMIEQLRSEFLRKKK